MQVLFYIADGDRVWPGENDVFSLLVTMQSSAASSWSGHRWLNRPMPKDQDGFSSNSFSPFPISFLLSQQQALSRRVGSSFLRLPWWIEMEKTCIHHIHIPHVVERLDKKGIWFLAEPKIRSPWFLSFLFTFISVKSPLQHLCCHLFSMAASVFALYLSAACQGNASEFIRCKVYALHTAANWCELQ